MALVQEDAALGDAPTTPVPSDRQVLARLRREGRSEDYIRSYMRGWRQPAGVSRGTRNADRKRKRQQ